MKLSTSASARIVEVFSSLQGEGTRLGERQVFVRFGGCNLHCDYCDEPDTIPIPSGKVWTLKKLQGEILRLAAGEKRQTSDGKQAAGLKHRTISWTGGEPLLHRAFLKKAMAWARAQGFENYLETNGVLVDAFRELAPLCDVVAMDLKLPSATGRETWSQHHEFLRIAPQKTFVKAVLTAGSTDAEWRQAIRLMQEAPVKIPFVLQPATAQPKRPGRRGAVPIEPVRAIRFFHQANALLKDVRLIPQWHPVWGVQ